MTSSSNLHFLNHQYILLMVMVQWQIFSFLTILVVFGSVLGSLTLLLYLEIHFIGQVSCNICNHFDSVGLPSFILKGEPNFDTDNLLIDWVRITPFNEPGDSLPHETFSNVGFADPWEYPSFIRNFTSFELT